VTGVSVVYHSASGHTRLMAEAVLEGAIRDGGAEGRIYALEGGQIVDGRWEDAAVLEALDASDAIVFGCPTHMGSISTPMKAFMDATLQRFYSRAWADKVGAGFTVSATPSGDKLNTLVGLALCARQLGMIWVGQEQTTLNDRGLNRLGAYLGVAGQAEYGGPEPALFAGDRESGEVLGARVAGIARALAAGR